MKIFADSVSFYLKVLIIVGLVFNVCSAAYSEIAVITAEYRDTPVFEQVVGTIQPSVVTTLSSKVMGNVLEVLKREGDIVSAGDILVKIDARDVGSDVDAARGALAEAQAAAAEVVQNLDAARRAKESAESGFSLAKKSHDRIADLLKAKSVSQQEYDQTKNAMVQAESEIRQAQSQIDALNARKTGVDSRIAQARAMLSKAGTIHQLAEVRAPFAGRITRRIAEPGTLAAPGVPLMTIEDNHRMLFEAIVPERLIHLVTEETVMDVIVDALDRAEFKGKVVEIEPSAHRFTHTFIVKIAIEKHPAMRSGMYARGYLEHKARPVMLIPQTAVEKRGQLEGVYLKGEKGPLFRLVRTGKVRDAKVEILSGLKPGDMLFSDAAKVVKGR